MPAALRARHSKRACAFHSSTKIASNNSKRLTNVLLKTSVCNLCVSHHCHWKRYWLVLVKLVMSTKNKGASCKWHVIILLGITRGVNCTWGIQMVFSEKLAFCFQLLSWCVHCQWSSCTNKQFKNVFVSDWFTSSWLPVPRVYFCSRLGKKTNATLNSPICVSNDVHYVCRYAGKISMKPVDIHNVICIGHTMH